MGFGPGFGDGFGDGFARDGADDFSPDPFPFADQSNVAPSTVRVSNTIVVSGLGAANSVTVTITGGEYSKNGGAFTVLEGTAVNGDTFVVRHQASASFATAVNSVLTIGDQSDTFTSTTYAEGYVPPESAREVSLRAITGVRSSMRSMTVR